MKINRNSDEFKYFLIQKIKEKIDFKYEESKLNIIINSLLSNGETNDFYSKEEVQEFYKNANIIINYESQIDPYRKCVYANIETDKGIVKVSKNFLSDFSVFETDYVFSSAFDKIASDLKNFVMIDEMSISNISKMCLIENGINNSKQLCNKIKTFDELRLICHNDESIMKELNKYLNIELKCNEIVDVVILNDEKEQKSYFQTNSISEDDGKIVDSKLIVDSNGRTISEEEFNKKVKETEILVQGLLYDVLNESKDKSVSYMDIHDEKVRGIIKTIATSGIILTAVTGAEIGISKLNSEMIQIAINLPLIINSLSLLSKVMIDNNIGLTNIKGKEELKTLKKLLIIIDKKINKQELISMDTNLINSQMSNKIKSLGK